MNRGIGLGGMVITWETIPEGTWGILVVLKLVGDFKNLPSRKLAYSFKKTPWVDDDFPFPKVGYVSPGSTFYLRSYDPFWVAVHIIFPIGRFKQTLLWFRTRFTQPTWRLPARFPLGPKLRVFFKHLSSSHTHTHFQNGFGKRKYQWNWEGTPGRYLLKWVPKNPLKWCQNEDKWRLILQNRG